MHYSNVLRIKVILMSLSRAMRLFALPRWYDGVASLVDLGGVYPEFNVSPSVRQADAEALAADWWSVGDDLRESMYAVEREQQNA